MRFTVYTKFHNNGLKFLKMEGRKQETTPFLFTNAVTFSTKIRTIGIEKATVGSLLRRNASVVVLPSSLKTDEIRRNIKSSLATAKQALNNNPGK